MRFYVKTKIAPDFNLPGNILSQQPVSEMGEGMTKITFAGAGGSGFCKQCDVWE